jgi:DNA-binding LacI/PurR family transcriptional regulator
VPVPRALHPRPTINAVADRADVAISTVSRVLNGGRTSEDVRRRVRRAIEELGYTPSVAARNLVTRRTDCIGLAVNSTQSAWFSEIAPDLPADAAYSVRSDNLSAGRLVAEHLAELGHRSVGFATGPEEATDARERLQGLEQGLAQRGIAIDPRFIHFGQAYIIGAAIDYAQSFLQLPQAQRPTAVVLGNDTMALAFMRTVLAHGLQVPRDVSVVGFDGTPDGEQCWPGLTTVAQATRRMAKDACRALLRRINRDPAGNARVEYPVQLLVRESSGPPGADHRDIPKAASKSSRKTAPP